MTNFDLSLHIFEFFRQAGITQVVVCAGARNAPLVEALNKQNLKVFSFFEERSAAFFAIGLIKAYSRPVAVMTTSGTAAAELLPACVEAFYQGLPLVLVTADRPKKYRNTGSPQTINQVGLFKNFVENEYDFDCDSRDFTFNWGYQKPIHLNVSFDEPLIDNATLIAPPFVRILKTSFEQKKSSLKFTGLRPMIILGEIEESQHEKVIEFLLAIRAPIYAESLSGLRYRASLEPFALQSSDKFVKEMFRQEFCDSIIRIGGVPTLRFWRDLEKEFSDVPVLNYTNLSFSGLSRDSVCVEIKEMKATQEFPPEILSLIKKMDSKLQLQKQDLFKKYPESEQSFIHNLSKYVGPDPIYLGNSLPIRHWDQFTLGESRGVYANRGSNGIDGQISTYLGWSQNKTQSYALIGDLTAMYDMAGLGLATQLNEQKRNLIILNNFGGQIFKRVFESPHFINSHKTHFIHLAKMWNWSYLFISSSSEMDKLTKFNTSHVMIEIVPDASQTEAFWKDWDEACEMA
jgi:2-succinyl-5-enolpyruvyl-6-hydroxy-3-cyclohexene-1-carboxylate synthase